MEDSPLNTLAAYFTAPVQILCLIALVYLVKKYFFRQEVEEPDEEPVEVLEPMKKRDFALQDLKEYDGRCNSRILIAVNGKVFDVTLGRNYYGPDRPYGVFAGKDASRGLATFSVDGSVLKEEYDDLSDLNSMQLDSLKEWEMQFTEKYVYVGRLLKPGEKGTDYESDTEEDESKASSKKNK